MPDNMTFRVLHVDMTKEVGKIIDFGDRAAHLGGSGLAAALFEEFGDFSAPALDPKQPIIFAVGPLTGYFPLMSKVVCGFKSPYNEQYTESHAGGRLGLSIRFAGLDAIMFTGKARILTCMEIGARAIRFHEIPYLAGLEALASGKYFRRFGKSASGHRSTMRIGPAGENLSAMACINVDTYRHFGRLGCGAVLGSKNIKAVVVKGDSSLPAPEGKAYANYFKEIHQLLTQTEMMSKYYDLGTPVNMAALNELKALPWNNMQTTSSDKIKTLSGEVLANDLLLRQAACSGCPVGCIHIGLVRQLVGKKHDYIYRQVSYDHETVFAHGSMLGMSNSMDMLAILDETEKMGLDGISAGIALAWATEAFQKGLISEHETIVPLEFDNVTNYRRAISHLGHMTNDFYATLAQGTLKAAEVYGGTDFACVLGQEMAGYGTGEVFFVSQSQGFRHSHLDSGGYSYDQKAKDKNVDAAVQYMLQDEHGRVMLTCMVACLFARGVYSQERLQTALESTGDASLAAGLETASENIRRKRWQLKFRCGYKPEDVQIPKRYSEITTWKGPIDKEYMDNIRSTYIQAVKELAKA